MGSLKVGRHDHFEFFCTTDDVKNGVEILKEKFLIFILGIWKELYLYQFLSADKWQFKVFFGQKQNFIVGWIN